MVQNEIKAHEEELDLDKIQVVKQDAIQRLTKLRKVMDQSSVMDISQVLRNYRKQDFSRKQDSRTNLTDDFEKEITHLEAVQADIDHKLKQTRKKLADLKSEYEGQRDRRTDKIRLIQGKASQETIQRKQNETENMKRKQCQANLKQLVDRQTRETEMKALVEQSLQKSKELLDTIQAKTAEEGLFLFILEVEA